MKRVEELSGDELLAELGVEADPVRTGGLSARQERILAGFEDIVRFVEEHDRHPRHGEHGDIFERLYAIRLDRIRKLPNEDLNILRPLDKFDLLTVAPAIPEQPLPEGDELIAELSEGEPTSDIGVLKYVRSTDSRDTPEEIADRGPCKDFEQFRPLFEAVQADLAAGRRDAKRFIRDASIEAGDFFILRGDYAYVAAVGDPFKAPNGETDARLRVIYANGTESNLLRRSLQRALYKDDQGRRITQSSMGPLFDGTIEDGDLASGTVYVLRSLSKQPEIAAVREVLHKIGVTGGRVETRIANAELDATFLLAPVEVVATWKLANINRFQLEQTIHRVFQNAQMKINIPDRFGNAVEPREWFLVALPVIDEVIQRIKDRTITDFVYDPAIGGLRRIDIDENL